MCVPSTAKTNINRERRDRSETIDRTALIILRILPRGKQNLGAVRRGQTSAERKPCKNVIVKRKIPHMLPFMQQT